MIIGIVLIAVAALKAKCKNASVGEQTEPKENTFCQYSTEAKRAGFDRFMDNLKKTYYELHPHTIFYDPEMSKSTDQKGAAERVRREYVAFDTTPSVIKKRTDTAWKLLKDLNNLGIVEEKLKSRERKALAQARHYLKQVFGLPYDVNYYSGEWMLGPDLFCYRQICYLGYGVFHMMRHLKPKRLSDVRDIESKLKTHKKAVETYVENMRIGVRKGMIRNTESCLAGINAMKRANLNISLFNETGRWVEIEDGSLLDRIVSLFYLGLSRHRLFVIQPINTFLM